jgi:heat shock protein HtpX
VTVFWNGVKTALLLGLLMGVCLAVGQFWGTQGLMIGFLFGGVGVIISYFFSDKIALMSMSAQPVDRASAPELYEMAERLAQRAQIPMPRLYYSPQPAPNAFATGRNPAHGVVCVTEGLMAMLSPRELEGVLGHEISHIKHRDILISTVAAVIAGALSQLAWSMMWFGGGGNRNRDGEGNALLGLLVLILAPIAAMLIQMAISRSREYAADASGAQLAGGPEGLISALQKLEAGNRRVPMQVNPSESHMFIVKPMIPGAGAMSDLFRTHPSTESRIAKLLESMGKPNPYAAMV